MKISGRRGTIDIEPGALCYEPPPPRVCARPPRKGIGAKHWNNVRDTESPGWAGWAVRFHSYTAAISPVGRGRPPGAADGTTKEEREKMINKYKISDADFQAAWDELEDEKPIVKVVMREHLLTLRNPGGTRDKEFAKKELAAYYKDKPVTKKAIEITENHDDWISDVESELDGKAKCQKPN